MTRPLLGERSSGVLLHLTSLPSGRLDDDAYRFVDWLVEAGQSWWQLLPVHPPDRYGSPYASASAFAGWHGLLDPSGPPASADEPAEPWLEQWIAHAGEHERERQARFRRDWLALRRYANDRGVRLIGDIPLYVDGSSCDAVSNPHLFDDTLVAGAAPSPNTPRGQDWGMPVYDWAANAADGFAWWTARLAREVELFDLVRIDHFRGLVQFWAIEAGEADPARGRWLDGPGRALFDAAEATLGRLPFVLEDLGVITPDVDALREDLDLPGMTVVARGPHACTSPSAWRADSVLYSSTHDSETLAGWWRSHGQALYSHELAGGRRRGQSEHWAVLERIFATPNPLVVVQAQDVLELGSDARMNTPGTCGGRNWRWRLDRPLGPREAERLRAVTERSGRVGTEPARAAA